MALDTIARGMAGQVNEQVETLQDIVNNQYKSMFRYIDRLGSYSDLPSTGNDIGDSYYIINGDSEHGDGLYTWEYDKNQNKSVWKYVGPFTQFNFDDTPTEGSKNAVTSEGIKKYIDEHSGGGGSLIDYLRIEGESEDLEVIDKRAILPLATKLKTGMIKLGDEFDLDKDNKMILAKDENGLLNIPDDSVSVTKLMVPEKVTFIIEDDTEID